MKTICYRGNRDHAGLRLFLLLVIAMGACFWIGGQGVYTAVKNRRPVTLAYEDLAKGKPSAHWLVLTNCELQIAGSAYKLHRSKYEPSGTGRITEAYIPIYAPGQDESNQCHAVMATKDGALLALLEEMRQATTGAQAELFLAKHGSELQVRRTVEGLVRFGAEEHGEKGKLAGLRGDLAPGFIIVAEGQRPEFSKSLGLVILGVLIGAGMFFYIRSSREESTADAY